jgi:hypothetical protein
MLSGEVSIRVWVVYFSILSPLCLCLGLFPKQPGFSGERYIASGRGHCAGKEVKLPYTRTVACGVCGGGEVAFATSSEEVEVYLTPSLLLDCNTDVF